MPRTGRVTQIYFPPGLRAIVDELAKRSRRSVSTEVIMAVEEWAAKHGLPYQGEPQPKPKKRGNK